MSPQEMTSAGVLQKFSRKEYGIFEDVPSYFELARAYHPARRRGVSLKRITG
jgi:hypothetical protein